MNQQIECIDSANGDDWMMINGDCVEVLRQMPDQSIDLSIFSPPFVSLYTYSDSLRDMGNCAGLDEFVAGYRHLARELARVTRPGRIVAVHCMDTPTLKYRDGHTGIADFPGALIRAHIEEGLVFHARITIWKDPVTEMQRTKAHGLLYKNIREDSTRNRVGLPDYVLVFRKPDDGSDAVVPVTHTFETFPLDQWQEWASPVWMTIDQGRTLNARVAREDGDERHMCPLQLDTVERLVMMYSNPGDVVLSPFGGVGSEGVGALAKGRKYIGVELKPSYYESAVKFLTDASWKPQVSLFGGR